MISCSVHVRLSYEVMKASVELVGGRMPKTFQTEIDFVMDSPVDIWNDNLWEGENMSGEFKRFLNLVSSQLVIIEPYYGLGMETMDFVKVSTGEKVSTFGWQIDLSNLFNSGE